MEAIGSNDCFVTQLSSTHNRCAKNVPRAHLVGGNSWMRGVKRGAGQSRKVETVAFPTTVRYARSPSMARLDSSYVCLCAVFLTDRRRVRVTGSCALGRCRRTCPSSRRRVLAGPYLGFPSFSTLSRALMMRGACPCPCESSLQQIAYIKLQLPDNCPVDNPSVPIA